MFALNIIQARFYGNCIIYNLCDKPGRENDTRDALIRAFGADQWNQNLVILLANHRVKSHIFEERKMLISFFFFFFKYPSLHFWKKHIPLIQNLCNCTEQPLSLLYTEHKDKLGHLVYFSCYSSQ